MRHYRRHRARCIARPAARLGAGRGFLNSEVDPRRIEVILSRIRQKAKAADMELPIRVIFGKGLAFVPSNPPD